MAKARTLDRRAALRGGCGALVALPFLELMRPRRAAAASPRMRYVVAFGGLSPRPLFPPKTMGAKYELTIGLRPLGGSTVDPVAGRPRYTWGAVRDNFSVVTNLRVPTSGAGAYRGAWHSSVVGPLLSGVSSVAEDEAARKADKSSATPLGITSDLVAAEALGAGSRFKWLGYRAQPEPYRTTEPSGPGSMSHNGKSVVTPVHSPRTAYDQFFRDFAVPGEAADPASRLTLDKEKSVLDLVSFSAARLRPRLGRADLARLDEHFTQIREMERRIAALGTPAAGTQAACKRLPDPGQDPATSKAYKNEYASNRPIGYSDEDQRARILFDLVHLAFACDHARAASVMITYPMCFMTIEPILGDKKVDLHDLGHGEGDESDMARAASWHVEHVARFADKLRATPEDDGNLLDRTVIVFLTEGGCVGATHSSERATVLVGGGKAGGLAQGVAIDGRGRHPVNVLVSALRAAQVPVDRLGEVQGGITELGM